MGSVYFLTVLVLRAKIFQVESTKETFHRERERVDESFAEIYVEAVSKAEEVGVEPKLPRVASRQMYKSNTPAQSPEDYFKRNNAIPFLDHIINNLDAKFDGAQIYICSLIAFYLFQFLLVAFSRTAASLLCLTPTVLCSEEVDISEVVKMYHDDLPSPELIQPELQRWKQQ